MSAPTRARPRNQLASASGKLQVKPASGLNRSTQNQSQIHNHNSNSISNSNSNSNQNQAQHQQQIASDGRRTLIKNQLYLIEQLQLENANLRSERDQLQLENEELKFQLQMISSSSSNLLGARSNQQEASAASFGNSDQAPMTILSNRKSGSQPAINSLANGFATPLRLPRLLTGNSRATSQPRLDEHQVESSQFNFRSTDDEEEHERLQIELVQRRLGHLVEPDRVRAAALVIQRAFRRHQICQRFRTITEQLRRRSSLNGSTQSPAKETSTTAKKPTASDMLSRAAQQLIANTMEAKQQQAIPEGPTRRPNLSQSQLDLRLREQESRNKALSNMQQLERHRALLYRVGLNIFNKSPEKGLSYFIAHNFIETGSQAESQQQHQLNHSQVHFVAGKTGSQLSSNLALAARRMQCDMCVEEENLKRNVAEFLATRRGLSREKIGLYLGNLQEPFNQEVLKCYLEAFDFSSLEVDVALRKFLSGFRLPGEAQKIERLVEMFAARYVDCQAGQNEQQQQDQSKGGSDLKGIMMLTKDEIFILSFAIIMLNTDLHSPSMKPTNRMSAKQFVNNLRGLFKSQPVEEGHLIEIYQRIKANQISTIPDHMVNLVHVQRRLVTLANFQRKEIIPNICQPHRRMVCYCRVYELYDPNKKERAGQHQRELYLFNDLILVCKIARRTKANCEPPLALRSSLSLQGLGVELFQSAHYDYGIRLFQLKSNSTVMMFNSVNKQDQIRFTRDLEDSMAEMREMEEVKNKNMVDQLHNKFLDKLKRHRLLHEQQTLLCESKSNQSLLMADRKCISDRLVGGGESAESKMSQLNESSTCDSVSGDNLTSCTIKEEEVNDLNSDSISATSTTSGASSSSNMSGSSDPTSKSNILSNRKQTLIVGAGKERVSERNSNSMTDLRQKARKACPQTHETTSNCDSADPASSLASLLLDEPARSSSSANTSSLSNTSSSSSTNSSNQHCAITEPAMKNNDAIKPGIPIKHQQQQHSTNTSNMVELGVERKCSASSVFSHDSGLFISRDVSPNQSS